MNRHDQAGRDPVDPDEELLTSADVAAQFGVDRRTVLLWAKDGRITTLRTPGGHHRFRASEIRRLLEHADADPERP